MPRQRSTLRGAGIRPQVQHLPHLGDHAISTSALPRSGAYGRQMKVRKVLLSAGAAWVVALGTVLGPVGSGASHAATPQTSRTPIPAVGSTVGQQATDPWFSTVKFTPTTIYPQVRDGYKDYVNLYWYSDDYDGDENAPYGADYTVTNSDGEVVFAGHVGTDKTYLRWRGVDDSGGKVPVGVYTVTLTAYDAGGDGHVLTREVTVATGEVLKRDRVVANADTPGRYRAAARGNCDVRSESTDVLLACWDGKFAMVTFTLNIPAKRPDNAQVTKKYFMYGKRECCRRGTLTKKVWKVDRDTIKASMKVTGRCAYRIRGVVMHYTYTTRI